MKGEICLCPATWAIIKRMLRRTKAGAKLVTRVIQTRRKRGSQVGRLTRSGKIRKGKSRKRPTAKQMKARRLFVMRVKRGDFR